MTSDLAVQNARIEYRKKSSSSVSTAYYNGTISEAGTYSVILDGVLEASSEYEFRAAIDVYEDGSYTPIYGAWVSFSTTAASSNIPSGWLELPAITGNEDYVGTLYTTGVAAVSGNEADRNYSFNYSYDNYGALWVAYPLRSSDVSGNASTSSWSYYPSTYIPQRYQIDMTGSSYPTMYNASSYTKGHQIPNADRKSNSVANSQTYYVTNQTPQIGNKFNGSIWGSLETAVRNLTQNTDVVYVVTGAAYKTVGGNETVKMLTASSSSTNPQKVPVPNYYWKAILKVKTNSAGAVTSASAIGFWFEHKEYDSGTSYTTGACSVDYIEQMTGFDLFTNLPGDNNSGIEKTAESNTNWQTFQNF